MAGVKGRVALVTGAGSADGIGFATARLLAGRRRPKVAITSTTERIFERLATLVGAPDETFARRGRPDAIRTRSRVWSRRSRQALGPIDIVVNNAGMVQVGKDQPSRRLHETTDEGWRYGLDINLTSAFLVIRAVLPGMMARQLRAHRADVVGHGARGRHPRQCGLWRRQGRAARHGPRSRDRGGTPQRDRQLHRAGLDRDRLEQRRRDHRRPPHARGSPRHARRNRPRGGLPGERGGELSSPASSSWSTAATPSRSTRSRWTGARTDPGRWSPAGPCRRWSRR